MANDTGIYSERKIGEIGQVDELSEQDPASRRKGSASLAEAKHQELAISSDRRNLNVKGARSGLASLGDLPSLGKKMVGTNDGTFSSTSCAGSTRMFPPFLLNPFRIESPRPVV